jgi:hypothetical protein
MSNLRLFLKGNKKEIGTTTYPATKSLVDENGEPLLWTIKPLSTTENDRIRDDCTYEVAVTGKNGVYRQKINTSKYLAKMMCACIVEPNLYNKELQDSYGVMTPEDLLKEMIDNPAEYNDLATFIQNYNGFDETLQDKVEEAKN